MVGTGRPKLAVQFPKSRHGVALPVLELLERSRVTENGAGCPRQQPCVRAAARRGGVSLDIPFHRSTYGVKVELAPHGCGSIKSVKVSEVSEGRLNNFESTIRRLLSLPACRTAYTHGQSLRNRM